MNQRHILGRDLNAEITARNHDTVRDLQDRVEVLHALKIFDLRVDLHPAVVLFEQLADLLHVISALDERRCDEVHVLLDTEEDVILVLLRDRRQPEGNTWSRDALSRAHLARVQNRRHDVLALDLLDLQLDESVGKEQLVARLDLRVELLVVDRALRLIARCVVVRQKERLSRFEHDRAVLEFAKAHLRPLRVEQQRDDAPHLLRRLTHAVDALQMLVMRTMRKVETRDIHAVLDKLLHHARRIRRRPLRANDLRLLVKHTSSSIHAYKTFSCFYCTTIS